MDLFEAAARYPIHPGHKARETSREAAKSVRGRAATLRQAVCLKLIGLGPMTADECAAELGESVLSIRPRFSELSELGSIIDSGERRPNESGRTAIVWKLRP